ncbi:MAG: DUF3828 domain-containing protein [Anaerolineae bacterium]
MKGKVILGAGLAVLVAMTGLAVLAVGGPAVMFNARAQVTEEVLPEEVVTGFYDRYLGYIGHDGEARRNPLVDGFYRDCPELSEAFIAAVDETLASFDKGGFDPILLAQDVPVKVSVQEAEVAGDEARVTVEMFWGGNPESSERVVTLNRIDGHWEIVKVAF